MSDEGLVRGGDEGMVRGGDLEPRTACPGFMIAKCPKPADSGSQWQQPSRASSRPGPYEYKY